MLLAEAVTLADPLPNACHKKMDRTDGQVHEQVATYLIIVVTKCFIIEQERGAIFEGNVPRASQRSLCAE